MGNHLGTLHRGNTKQIHEFLDGLFIGGKADNIDRGQEQTKTPQLSVLW